MINSTIATTSTTLTAPSPLTSEEQISSSDTVPFKILSIPSIPVSNGCL